MSEERLRGILETANEGVWILDVDFVTTFANQVLADMLGLPQEQLIGRYFEEFIFEEDQRSHRLMQERRRQGQSDRYVRRLKRKDGSAIWTIVSAVPIMEDGAFTGSFAMLADLTEQKKVEQALRRERDVNAALARLSHDLISRMPDTPRFSRKVLEEACWLTESPDGFIATRDATAGQLTGEVLVRGAGGDSREYLFTPDDADTYPAWWGQALNRRASFNVNTPVARKQSR